MELKQILFFMILLIGGSNAFEETLVFDQNDGFSNHTVTAYSIGVHMGIINPDKYSLESFEWDERNVFKDVYKEYISLNYSDPISYQEWLILNNYGIMSDTQESLFQRPTSTRSKHNRKRFTRVVKKGDILITKKGCGGLLGHAAIMVSDYWVLEMPGGKKWKRGIKSNNRQISKKKWYDIFSSAVVYRCTDSSAAREAANWADRHYFNPYGDSEKTIHVTYKITPDFQSTNPSYSSKLVLQAYYYGTGSRGLIRDVTSVGAIIIPTNIPAYFVSPNDIIKVGSF